MSDQFFGFAERNGLALHAVHAGDKNPMGNDWPSLHSRDLATWRDWLTAGCNIGLHPGASRVAVLDIEAGKQEIAEKWFQDVTGYSLPAPHVRSPSGGTHTYFRLADATGLWTLRQKTTGWGDLLVGSANAMLPPSYFANPRNDPSKKAGPYEWLGNETLYDGEILRPAWPKRPERTDTAPALDGFNYDRVARWIDRKVAGEWKEDPTALSQLDWTMLGAALKLHFGGAGLKLFQRMSHNPDQAARRWDKFPAEYSEGDRTLHWYLDRDIDWMFGDTVDVLNGKLVLPSPPLVPLLPGVPLPGPCEWYEPPTKLIKSSAAFIADFVPPEYVVDGILQRRFFYAITARTGEGKTAVAMRLSAHVATGRALGNIEVARGTVVYLAGENPVDVQMRWLGVTKAMGIDPDTVDVHFITRRCPLGEIADQIRAEVLELAIEPAMVIVDTSAAYSGAEDENSNTQAVAHALTVRTLTELPGGPCVVLLCHPTKRAADDDLTPRGGGALLAELDGNIGCRKVDRAVGLEVQGKFRGPQFPPLMFELDEVHHPKLRDARGRPIPTVVARPIDDAGRAKLAAQSRSDQDEMLRALERHPGGSLADFATALGWTYGRDNRPNKMRAQRALKMLVNQKLVAEHRDSWKITQKGERELNDLDRHSAVTAPPGFSKDPA
ncbi:AAA family ATPase [Bradyrhizobium sp. USDA 313]|uniref:AAA family ATPase n=1 Tax=Bradyrhizobium sp. USDA 313 TaxID=3156307 RepID=UPI00351473E3